MTGPYLASTRLVIPADAVWQVLASPAGARQRLGDPLHRRRNGPLLPILKRVVDDPVQCPLAR
jgi:hypothetical protein